MGHAGCLVGSRGGRPPFLRHEGEGDALPSMLRVRKRAATLRRKSRVPAAARNLRTTTQRSRAGLKYVAPPFETPFAGLRASRRLSVQRGGRAAFEAQAKEARSYIQ